MKLHFYGVFLFIFLSSCSRREEAHLVSFHTVDRNHFQETIDHPERLKTLSRIDFRSTQPYEKVVRVYSKEGKRSALFTRYHPNGQLWQYLETVSGRCHGKYEEWHENGSLSIRAHLIEGVGDLTESAASTWVFDGLSEAFDPNGVLKASIYYEKGLLHGVSRYYEEGKLKREVPFVQGVIDGVERWFDSEGKMVGGRSYAKGVLSGSSFHLGSAERAPFEEEFLEGKLIWGKYFDFEGHCHSIVEQGRGVRSEFLFGFLQKEEEIEGGQIVLMRLFQKGKLHSSCQLNDGIKQGEEIYFRKDGSQSLSIDWDNDEIHGRVRSWYPTGAIESDREFSHNKREGKSYSWYPNGEMMLFEEYQNDRLVEGKYFALHQSQPVSRVREGEGLATLYDAEGHLIQKVSYMKGTPFADKGSSS